MDCKEHLIYFFLQGKISLSQYDQKFLSNLQLMVHRDNRVTTNQSDLLNKLISKYSRQLSKNGLVKESLKELPWKAQVVESSPHYTGARVSLVDDVINLKVPFNKTFISEFRDVVHNPFEWQRDEKIYSAKFGTYALKTLKENLHKYFPTVTYCEQLQPLLDELKTYEAEVWDPTLVEVNGKPMVIALNPILGELVERMTLGNDVHTMFKLSQMGIKIHPSLITDAKRKFVSEFITEVDLDNMHEMASWLTELGIHGVILGRGLILNKPVKQHIVSTMQNHRINCIRSEDRLKSALKSSNQTSLIKAPILLQYHNQPETRAYYSDEAISKCVIIKNSRPIEVQ